MSMVLSHLTPIFLDTPPRNSKYNVCGPKKGLYSVTGFLFRRRSKHCARVPICTVADWFWNGRRRTRVYPHCDRKPPNTIMREQVRHYIILFDLPQWGKYCEKLTPLLLLKTPNIQEQFR